MAKKKSATRNLITDYKTRRTQLRLNQSQFWTAIGVTQSGGSRYESGRNIPRPVQMLLRVAYGTKAQAAKQLEALRPTTTVEATEEAAS